MENNNFHDKKAKNGSIKFKFIFNGRKDLRWALKYLNKLLVVIIYTLSYA